MRGIRFSVFLAAGLIWVVAGAASAQEELRPDIFPVCEPPISICKPHPVITPHEIVPSGLCPPGSTCTCVPSCPNCRDCAVFVCVPDGSPQCHTACDCEPGLGCFGDQCRKGINPIYCCDADVCPTGALCQNRDGSRGRCGGVCVDELWLCGQDDYSSRDCGKGRVCACTASCPFCKDCGPRVCVPEGASNPYRCGPDESCALPGDRCVCVPSCPECDDCRLSVCVPTCDVPGCDERAKKITERIDSLVRRAGRCEEHSDCVLANTSTECAATCGGWVNRRYQDRFEKFVYRLDERICSEYEDDGCPRPIPICPIARGVCVDGQCRGLSVMPIPMPPGPIPVKPPVDLGVLEAPVQKLLEEAQR